MCGGQGKKKSGASWHRPVFFQSDSVAAKFAMWKFNQDEFPFCFLLFNGGGGGGGGVSPYATKTNKCYHCDYHNRSSKIYISHIVRLGAATSSVVPSHFLFPPWWPVNITHQPPLFFFLFFLNKLLHAASPGPGRQEAAAARPSSRCAPAKTASQPPETCQSARKSK